MEYDVAIIGLGPAGSILARNLDKSLRVIAIDKKQMQGSVGFHKPCGGLLAPDAQKAISCFGLTLPLDVLVDPQIFSVRTIDVKTEIVRHYQRYYVNMDRHRFDQWLMSLIPNHVELHSDARCDLAERCDGGYRVGYKENGESRTIQTRFLVGADGAGSLVRRTIYPQARVRTYLSIQQQFKDAHATPFYSCVFDPDSTDCYAWGLTKDDSFVFGGAFGIKGARESFDSLKEKLKRFGFNLENPIKTEACLTLRPQGPGRFFCGRNGAFLIGEAAGFISPSSLEGISYAIDSGYILSRCLSRAHEDPNRAYRKATVKLRVKLLGKLLKSPFMYHPLLRKAVMASGLNSISLVPPPDGINEGNGVG